MRDFLEFTGQHVSIGVALDGRVYPRDKFRRRFSDPWQPVALVVKVPCSLEVIVSNVARALHHRGKNERIAIVSLSFLLCYRTFREQTIARVARFERNRSVVLFAPSSDKIDA